jgi:hypothetical protein
MTQWSLSFAVLRNNDTRPSTTACATPEAVNELTLLSDASVGAVQADMSSSGKKAKLDLGGERQ